MRKSFAKWSWVLILVGVLIGPIGHGSGPLDRLLEEPELEQPEHDFWEFVMPGRQFEVSLPNLGKMADLASVRVVSPPSMPPYTPPR